MAGAPLGIGIVGMGYMGQKFARVCAQLPQARLVAVYDPLEGVGRSTAERYGAYHCPDYAALVDRPDVDAVIVANPETAHVEPALAAFERGKPVLVEKPLAENTTRAQLIADAAAARGVPLLVGHVLRFATPYLVAAQAVAEGKVGTVHALQTRRLNVPAVQQRVRGRVPLPLFLGVHDYDVARWLTASEPVRVYAEAQYGVLRGLGLDVEDTHWALITFRSGAVVACEVGSILPPGHPTGFDSGFWVQGSTGRLDVNLSGPAMVFSGPERSTYPDTVFGPEVYGEVQGCYVEELRHFLACARGEASPRITPGDAVAAVKIAEAAIESARTHRPVDL